MYRASRANTHHLVHLPSFSTHLPLHVAHVVLLHKQGHGLVSQTAPPSPHSQHSQSWAWTVTQSLGGSSEGDLVVKPPGTTTEWAAVNAACGQWLHGFDGQCH
jgi:hypothetical protein